MDGDDHPDVLPIKIQTALVCRYAKAVFSVVEAAPGKGLARWKSIILTCEVQFAESIKVRGWINTKLRQLGQKGFNPATQEVYVWMKEKVVNGERVCLQRVYDQDTQKTLRDEHQ